MLEDAHTESDIRNEYVPGQKGRGAGALARKYGVDYKVILRVVGGGNLKVLRGSTVWTDEMNAMLTRLWNVERLTSSKIGAEMGMSKNSIIGRARRMGLDVRNPVQCSIDQKRSSPRKPKPVRKISITAEFLPNQRVPEFKTEPLDLRGSKAWEPLPGRIPITLMELVPRSCRWPCNGGFCGCETTKGSWCDEHRKIGFRKVEVA